jgi:hypothetical protein
MRKFKLPVTWEMCGVMEVEAESLEDASMKVNMEMLEFYAEE